MDTIKQNNKIKKPLDLGSLFQMNQQRKGWHNELMGIHKGKLSSPNFLDKRDNDTSCVQATPYGQSHL